MQITCSYDSSSDRYIVSLMVDGREDRYFFDDKPAATRFHDEMYIKYAEDIEGDIDRCPPLT